MTDDIDLLERVESLKRIVDYGLVNGKVNMIVYLDVLQELFNQRAKLLQAVRSALTSLSQTRGQVPPIVTNDVADTLNRVNQELNLL